MTRTKLVNLGRLQIAILDDLLNDALDDPNLILGHIITPTNYQSVYKALDSLEIKLDKAKKELGL